MACLLYCLVILRHGRVSACSFKYLKETCVQRCLWGEGRGRVCVNWKTPQKFKIISRLLSIIVVCLHPPYQAQFSCQESVNRNQDSDKFSPGSPTPKRPKVGMNYGKRRARRREGAGDKAPACAIAAGRRLGRQTRCLVSVLTKTGINNIKKGQFILNSQIYALN